MGLEGLEGLDSFTLARRAQIEAKRRAVMPPMALLRRQLPAALRRPTRPLGIPGGVGGRLERGPERGVAGRLGPAFGGRRGRLVREFGG